MLHNISGRKNGDDAMLEIGNMYIVQRLRKEREDGAHGETAVAT